MRARKKNWTEKELATNERIINTPTGLRGKWSGYFKNENPIHIEIGCGKGRFITQTAAQNPDINYIAMERESHVIVTGMRAARDLDARLCFILGDVSDILEIFDMGELSRMYINFCDPWDRKKKWAKRRLTHRNFLNMYKQILNDEGAIFFKTDNRELFDFSLEEFQETGWRLENVTYDLHNTDFHTLGGNIMTEYEEKFSSQGLPIYRCEAYLNTQNLI